MLKFQKKLTGSFLVFAPTRVFAPDAGQNPGATKIPLPLYRRGIKSVRQPFSLHHK